MAIIGTFTKKEDGDFHGTIATLTLNVHATFESFAKRSDKSPDFRIMAGLSDLGAAWENISEDGQHYFSVRLDDPSFTAPLDCRLIKSKTHEHYNLLWDRRKSS